MKFCDNHWSALRTAIDERGLGDLVSSSGEEMALRATGNGFDPLMGAHNAIVSNLVRVAGIGLMSIDGCPICEGNAAHDEGCADPDCRPNWYDAWIDKAADDALTEARERGLANPQRDTARETDQPEETA